MKREQKRTKNKIKRRDGRKDKKEWKDREWGRRPEVVKQLEEEDNKAKKGKNRKEELNGGNGKKATNIKE